MERFVVYMQENGGVKVSRIVLFAYLGLPFDLNLGAPARPIRGCAPTEPGWLSLPLPK